MKKICPNCKEQFDTGNFCKFCGAKLVEKAEEPKCPKCGTPAVNGAKFCNMCGSPLTAEPKSEDVETLFNLDFIEIPELHIKMLRTPVTKEMFKSVTEELRRAFEPDTFDSVFPLYKAEWIENFYSGFSRYDAEKFCSALSRLSKWKMLFRLPTNDEFDYVLSHKIPIHYDLKKEWTQDLKGKSYYEQKFYYYRDFLYKKGQKDWAQDGASSDFVFRIVRSM